MTTDATAIIAPAIAPAPPESDRGRGYFASAWIRTFRQAGAKVGMTWIVIVVFAGVFAPLIASSYPIAMRDSSGHWSSPMFKVLDYADITLMLLTLIGVASYVLQRLNIRQARYGLWLVAAIVALTPLTYLLRPGQPPVSDFAYEHYRMGVANGSILRAIHTIIPYSPSDRLTDKPSGLQSNPPSREHWLGTTDNAEDVLSRMIHASRTAVSVGFVATSIALFIGVLVGGVMGYFVGVADIIGMRLIEIFEAIPTLILIITFVTFYRDYMNIYSIMAIIGATSWTGDARFVRAEFLRLRDQDFVHAAKAAGLPLRSILFRHMLPNGITPLLISTSFGVASAILTESYLSFLGLGIPDRASWGQMLDAARGQGTSFAWWLAVFPGGAIFLTVFAYNLIGESVRDALDPKLLQRDS